MPTFSLTNLRAKALSRVDNNSTLYTNPELDWVINEAIRVTSLFTGYYRTTVRVPGFTKPNQLVYKTPPGMLVPGIVSFEGRQLQKISLKKLARQRRTWATDTTAANGRMEYWAPIGISQFVITPRDSQGGRDLAMSGIGEPPLLVNPTDVMALENEYVELIIDYCANRLPLKVGGKIFADGSVSLKDFWAKMKERLAFEQIKWPKYYLIGPNKGGAA